MKTTMEQALPKLDRHRAPAHTESLWRRISRNHFLYLLLIPFLLWYGLFAFKPMWGIQIAFKDYSVFKGMAASPWVGLEHFRQFWESIYFVRVLKNTLLINFYSILFVFPAPIVLALLLNEVKNVAFKGAVQTLTYLPHFISIVIVCGLVTNFLSPSSGLVNLVIEKFGGHSIYFLADPAYFRTIFNSMTAWQEAGFSAIIYIAALSGINSELYEAAVIDGANKWKQVLHITIPGILPTIMILLILKIGSLLDVGFEAIILLYQPATYDTADVISTYVYRQGIVNGGYDLATAVGLFNSVIGFTLVVISNWFSRKFTGNGLW